MLSPFAIKQIIDLSVASGSQHRWTSAANRGTVNNRSTNARGEPGFCNPLWLNGPSRNPRCFIPQGFNHREFNHQEFNHRELNDHWRKLPARNAWPMLWRFSVRASW
jgi:hypothetical protein